MSPITADQQQAHIAQYLKTQRTSHHISRRELSVTSGVPESTIKRFETTGNISLTQFLMLWDSLDHLERIDAICVDSEVVPLCASDVLRGNFQ